MPARTGRLADAARLKFTAPAALSGDRAKIAIGAYDGATTLYGHIGEILLFQNRLKPIELRMAKIQGAVATRIGMGAAEMIGFRPRPEGIAVAPDGGEANSV